MMDAHESAERIAEVFADFQSYFSKEQDLREVFLPFWLISIRLDACHWTMAHVIGIGRLSIIQFKTHFHKVTCISLHKANLTTIRERFNIRLFIMVFCYKYYFFKNYFQFTGSSILGQQNMSGEKGYLMSCENFYMFYDATVVASVA